MSLSSLNKAVNSLVLGNKTVYNFIDYIGGIHLTGGIKRYTAARGYYLNNISFNYDRGLIGRYGYGNYVSPSVDDVTAREKIQGTDGVRLEGGELVPATLIQERIGDYYGIDGVERNSERHFTTVNEFTELGDAIRFENTKHNITQFVLENRYGADYNDAKLYPGIKSSSLPSDELGTQYDFTYPRAYINLFGTKKELRLSSVEDRDIVTANNVIYEPYNDDKYSEDKVLTTLINKKELGDELTLTEKDKDKLFTSIAFSTNFNKNILETGEKIRERYSQKRITSEVVENLIGQNSSLPLYPKAKAYIMTEHAYGDLVEIGKDGQIQLVSSQLGIGPNGIVDYYAEELSRYDALKKSYRGYSFETPYAVIGLDGNRYFKMDSKYEPTPDHSIGGRNGAFRVNGIYDGRKARGASYHYYEEMDKGAAVTSSTPDGVSDGFAPSVTSFQNSSNIMKRTNELFRNGTIKSLVNRFHTDSSDVNDDDFLVSSYSEAGISRGRNLLRGDTDSKSGFDNPYCRVWTAHHQYSQLKNRIRPFMDGDTFMSIKELQNNYGRLRPNNGAQRLNDYSVLQDNGYVKITPFHENGKLAGGRDSLKKYMFSIENLAWKDYATKEMLANEQIGPFGGRIMWFPPYNLKFNENINTSWRDNEFIGRGEKIYTYANTERGGTLDFTLLIDHPSILNKASNMGESGLREEDVLRFFAGCGKLNVTDVEDEPAVKNEMDIDDDNNDNKTPELKPLEERIEFGYIVFYPNNFSAKKYLGNIAEAVSRLDEYEMSSDGSSFKEMDEAWERQKLADMNYDSKSLFSLNRNRWDADTAKKIGDLLGIDNMEKYDPYYQFKKLGEKYNSGSTEGETGLFGYSAKYYEIDNIEVRGFASSHGYEAFNQVLAKDRANMISKLAQYFCASIDTSKITTGECEVKSINKDGMPDDVNDKDAKIARSAVITFKLKLRDDVTPPIDANAGVEGTERRIVDGEVEYLDEEDAPNGVATAKKDEEVREVVVSNTFHSDGDRSYYTYQNEFMYFKQLEATNNLVYKSIVDKVKFFDPAFHSMTPEGFNARLNFLHQCTRQGPTIGSHSGDKNPDKSKMSEMAGNLAFGRAPYCILRIGDFYYSKIIIDSISINYDVGSGIQWDLNPEGVGVQPMMATVNISFKFVGGQDIDGPVAQLQNAISYNYYANSSIYTPSTQQSIPTVILDEE